jgi:hypothetical protein
MRLSGCMAGKLRREKMKLIVAGGRDYTDKFCSTLNYRIGRMSEPVTEVVCGMAKGADRVGFEWAVMNDIPVARFPAEWDKWGKGAGYRRNAEMAKYADALLAFWDGESKGTKHMIDLANKEGLLIAVYDYTGQRVDV